jgi:hypothetical protein
MRTNSNYQSISKQREAGNFAGWNWKSNKPNVQCAVSKSVQLKWCRHFLHRNLNPWKADTKSLNEVRETGCQRREAETNAQKAGFSPHSAAGNVDCELPITKQSASVFDQHLARSGQRQVTRPSDKERTT